MAATEDELREIERARGMFASWFRGDVSHPTEPQKSHLAARKRRDGSGWPDDPDTLCDY